MKSEIIELLNENASIVEKELKQYLSCGNDNGMAKIMEYSLLSGGKRIRPFLTIEAFKLFSQDLDIKKVLPYACAIEMIHTYSLIHDDLPCMDNDDLRRGKLTSHKMFGEAQALLAGDCLLTYAFEVISSNKYVSDKSIVLAVRSLSEFSGFSGMAGGQMIDLSSQTGIKNFSELKNMHSLKTGALIICAVLLGYYAACDNPNETIVKDLKEYALNLGIAFQIRDDILDKISNVEELGKPVGSDEKNEKTTSLSFMSIEEAQDMVEELTSCAIGKINKYCNEVKNCTLIDLAKFMTGREK